MDEIVVRLDRIERLLLLLLDGLGDVEPSEAGLTLDDGDDGRQLHIDQTL